MHKRLDPPLLDGETEEERDTSRGTRLASRSWKTPENRFSPEHLERTLPCRHLDVSPRGPVPDLRPPEPWDNVVVDVSHDIRGHWLQQQ